MEIRPLDSLCEASAPKLERLRAWLREQGSVLVAYSGGVDSAFVLAVARDVLGDRAVALTAVSASVPAEELDAAKALAAQLGARHILVDSNELSDGRYAANPSNRCYFCKSELYRLCEAQRRQLGLSVAVDGFNADDRKDHRPGHQAAVEAGVSSPLATFELSKAEIRAWSRQWDLPTWDKPAMPCLASRIPYGTAVTSDRLQQIGRAEQAVRALGLREFRVRYHGAIARLEVAEAEYATAVSAPFRAQASQALRGLGFEFVTIDLEPFRSGRLNDGLALANLASEGLPLPVVR